ncbi:2-amino-4-hydroxy-6-hydroxymethyldihydropteridine diphosphokinase [Streptosporangium sp. NBC_01755]|uniref:2-amino-4-hydroxy-6- hydroxymethyldihydropteridine diphosphokinase n=1 Tax=unclassified Streptosporangium TaxID=2632669 RepID=UPI002DDA7D69|nr:MULTISPECIES: 2-amino-4-hydroxy-6-hydroxymethyldihydropteridine diphosphokinase [unclassified Streptosporangium]WSA25465.1 2-amino-4-hydroxy-6-hydroxymethyldihydropteridine diphosphokinase [Streptosporangium sp. NBC_01810]WSD03146.1 2-amino-4-hydroxy-6-hydroxymethyldihydropteridine diphosphokinase [Streptosporangium sp. NBC_01755]
MRAVLALGSNLGDRFGTLRGGLDALFAKPGLTLVAVSPVYETDPVGGPEQGAYLNAVVIAESTLEPRALLDRAQGVENAFGRVRVEHWGARTLDVDLITVGDVVMDDPDLTLPHPRAHERAFVLVPWVRADPDAVLSGRRVADLLAGLDQDRVRPRPESLLQGPG